MKNRIFQYILILVFGIFSGNLVQAQDYQSEAIYLKLVKEYQLNDDGSFDFNYSKQLKLNSYFAINRIYGETFIVYNPQYQELKINEAYTIMADGKKVITPDNAFNEVLPRYAANAPAFNNLREMVVTHTGLERNAIINLDYTIHSSKDFLPDFFGKEMFNQSSPVKEMIFRIKVPANKTLQFKTLNIRTAPEITNENGQKVYTWIFKNLQARSHDRLRPADDIFLPGIIFSTAKDLHHVYDKFIDSKSFYYISNNAMTAIVDDMLAKEKDQMEIILDLQKLVVNDINYWNVPLEITAYKCRKAVETWNTNGGTALEKTILLTTMLIKAGINAIPVAVIPDKFYDPSIGCLKTFNNFLVRVNPQKHEQLYISAIHLNNQNLKYNLAGNTLSHFNPGLFHNPFVQSVGHLNEQFRPALIEQHERNGFCRQDLGNHSHDQIQHLVQFFLGFDDFRNEAQQIVVAVLFRNRNDECTPYIFCARHADGAAVLFDDVFDDRQPQPDSFVLGRVFGLDPEILFEYLVDLMIGYANAFIPNGNAYIHRPFGGLNDYCFTLFGIFSSVTYQVDKHFLHQIFVGVDPGQVHGDVRFDLQFLLVQARFHAANHFLDQLVQIQAHTL